MNKVYHLILARRYPQYSAFSSKHQSACKATQPLLNSSIYNTYISNDSQSSSYNTYTSKDSQSSSYNTYSSNDSQSSSYNIYSSKDSQSSSCNTYSNDLQSSIIKGSRYNTQLQL